MRPLLFTKKVEHFALVSPVSHKVALVVVLLLGGALSSCAHSAEGGGAGFGRNSAEARITHLISEGQFAEAEALIAESASSGLVEKSAAMALRKQITDLSMKLGEIHARLQRAPNKEGIPDRAEALEGSRQ